MKRLIADVNPAAAEKYSSALKEINSAEIPFLVGGGLAYSYHTGYPKDFHDLDLFCKAGDYPRILEVLKQKGFTITVPDEKWLAKAEIDDVQIDVISSIPNSDYIVNDAWFENGRDGELFGETIKVMGPEELFWCKIYVQTSIRFDGPDMYRLIIKIGDTLDWRRILRHMEADWEILFATCINFRFVFPSERSLVPVWLMKELLDRMKLQLDMPEPHDRVCRGILLSRADYAMDIREGGFII
jgi:hypothetical protein